MKELFRRLLYLLNRERSDQELASEMEFHREMAARDGGTPFGNPLRLREEARDAWGWTWIDRLSQDLRYGARMLRNSPGFTCAAVLMLALGLGVNIVAFGFFNLMVLRPLPVRDPASLRQFSRQASGRFADNLPYPVVAFYREHSRTLSAVLALGFGRLAVEGDEKPLHAHFVTANFFSELGARAQLGRVLDPDRDEAADAEPVVVLDHGLWQRRFGGDPLVIGRTLRLNGQVATVVGVAPREFSSLAFGNPDLWVPIARQPDFVSGSRALTTFSDDGGMNVFMWGRLQPAATPRVAEEELHLLAAELRAAHPADIWEDERMPSEPGGYATRIGPPMYPVLALVGVLCLLILAVACGNLGSLLLARGVARDREIGIRAAVGAGRARIVRQLLTESLLLAFVGCTAGLALAHVALRSLLAWAEIPAWLDPTPDWRVILFAASLGVLSAMVFGLTPALQVTRQRPRTTLARQFLIGAQVAASCVLLIVAGLLVRALGHATSTPPGFDYQPVISIDPGLYSETPASARTHLDELDRRLRGLPGVESVSLATNPPLGNRWSVIRTNLAGRAIGVHFNNVDPSFFRTMAIPLRRGRSLLAGETRAVVVSESLAVLQWPGEDPLGKTLRIGGGSASGDTGDTVVGVAGNARLVSPEDSDAVEVYRLAQEGAMPSVVVLVKTSVPPEGLVPPVTAIAKAVDPARSPEVELLKSAFRRKLQTSEYAALSVSLLGLVALLLACIGVVGLVAYAVAQRTKEIGIRMALGARPTHVVSAVLRQFSWPLALGLLAGTGGAAALSRILRQVLYGISNLDPLAYLAALAVFVAAVILAALLPARRALRVDPMQALRYE